VVEELLDRVESLELTVPVDELPYGASFINHGPASVPARLKFRAPAPRSTPRQGPTAW